MKVRQIAKILSVTLLLGVFLYATAVREFHYVFSAKYHATAHDHKCDHHIHSTEKEDDCSICKIDVNGLYHYSQSYYSFSVVFLPKAAAPDVRSAIISAPHDRSYLRGPPKA